MNAWGGEISWRSPLLPKTAGSDCAYPFLFKVFRLILNLCSWKREMSLPCWWRGKGGLGGGQGSCLLRKQYYFYKVILFGSRALWLSLLFFPYKRSETRCFGETPRIWFFGKMQDCRQNAAGAGLFITLLLLAWGSQALYAKLDRTEFPTPVQITDADKLDENAKGKALVDAITHQMRYELDSTFGWSINDILFNRFVLDNRAYRQYGVYHATKVLMDLYSMTIAKLGTNDRESEMLYKARLNSFAIDPRSFMFPSAESSYKKGLKLIEQYKESLDKGTGVYNCRTDDLYASFDLVIGENLLGYALGLLENSQELPFYTLDNRIYEVQGIVLVVRDFISALYELYPEISSKGNAGNMAAAIEYMNRICTYDPLYITSKVNSGELIISYVLFAKNRLEDIRNSIRI